MCYTIRVGPTAAQLLTKSTDFGKTALLVYTYNTLSPETQSANMAWFGRRGRAWHLQSFHPVL